MKRNTALTPGQGSTTMLIRAALTSKVMAGLVAAGLMLGTQASFADPGRWHDEGRDDRQERSGDYDYARVLDVQPIMREVRISTPRRECYNETRYEQVRNDDGPREPHEAAGAMILGGLIGAAVGHNIGHGDGRRAATVAGAVIGTAIGHDSAARRDSYGYSSGDRPYDVERCNVRYDDQYEQRIDGYRVTYEYNGQRRTTRLPYDPGDRIRVRIDVRPVG